MKNFVVNTFYKQRQDFERDAALHDKKFSMPKGVKEWKDLPYKNDGEKAHRMDVFRPKNREGETLPVIINVHGGGLLLGSKEFNRYYCARLCELGYVVFSIEYRLVPDCQVYDQFTDVADAMTHIFQSLSKFQGDSEQIYGVADSGGAYLLTYVTAMTGCRPLAKAAHTTPLLSVCGHWVLSAVCSILPALTRSVWSCLVIFMANIIRKHLSHRLPMRRIRTWFHPCLLVFLYPATMTTWNITHCILKKHCLRIIFLINWCFFPRTND